MDELELNQLSISAISRNAINKEYRRDFFFFLESAYRIEAVSTYTDFAIFRYYFYYQLPPSSGCRTFYSGP